MDSNSLDSELIESLEYLIPPVKRTHTDNTDKFINTKCINQSNKALYIKDFRVKKSQYTQCIRRNKESSTSLILKRTTESEVLEQYSILRARHSPINIIKERNRGKDKPIIRVTVIPKRTQTQSLNVCRKRKRNLKKIHSTLSNQEHSIRANDVTVKRDKKIKTSGSGQLTIDCNYSCNEKISLQQVTYLNQLISSLNMDTKKRNDKNKMVAGKAPHNYTSTDMKITRKISNLDAIRNDAADVNSKRSRIRITGSLGLTPDDRYILKCAATVEDLPVETFVDPQRVSDFLINNADLQLEHRRRERLQADISHRESNYDFYINKTDCDALPSVDSQGTQVNFDIGVTRKDKRNRAGTRVKTGVTEKRSRDVLQCCYCNIDQTNIANKNANFDGKRNECNELHKCHSPVVVISIYPSEIPSEKYQVIKNPKNSRHPSSKMNVPSNLSGEPVVLREKQNTEQPNKNIPFVKLPKQSFSAKPMMSQNVKNNKTNEIKNPKGNNRTESSKQQSLEMSTQNIQRRGSPKQDYHAKRNKNYISEKFRRKTEKGSKIYPAKKFNTTGTNTEHILTKKALVDAYTKKLAKQMYKNDEEIDKMSSVNNNSHVAVNIDGNNEQYDLSLRQADLSTELRVKKTLKGATTRRSSPRILNSPPKLNLFPSVGDNKEYNKKRSSAGKYNVDIENLHDGEASTSTNIYKGNPISKKKLRDSLEIFHRREDRSSQNLMINNNNKAGHKENLTAQVKHYRGDTCALPDPTRRDKEIRDLLGVGKTRTATCPHSSQIVPEYEKDIVLHYYHGKTCEESVLAHMSINPSPKGNKVNAWCDLNDLSSQNYDIETYKTNNLNKLIDNNKSKSANHINYHNAPDNKNVMGGIRVIKEVNNEKYAGFSDSCDSEPSSNDKDNLVNGSVKGKVDTKKLQLKPISTNDLKNLIRNQVISPIEYNQNKHATKSPSKYKEVHAPPVYNLTLVKQEPTSLCQQVILNREIQVFLQVEQVTDQTPIVLSHNQYDRLKSLIENTITKTRSRRKACVCKCSIMSIGEVRKRTKQYDHFINVEKFTQTDPISLTNNHSTESMKRAQFTLKKLQPETISSTRTSHTYQSKKTTVLFTNNEKIDKLCARQTVSSAENTNGNVIRLRHITLSSTSVVVGSTSTSLPQKDSCSIRTIFKGFRKCQTPNLGTSVCSLYSDGDEYEDCNSVRYVVAEESKQRKPFFKRLLSCLVLRSNRPSAVKITPAPPPGTRPPSYNSSIDSYHIDTSLGALEMSSSIYDTSASFYSEHSILPPVTRVKRGFLSSVRELLSNRRI